MKGVTSGVHTKSCFVWDFFFLEDFCNLPLSLECWNHQEVCRCASMFSKILLIFFSTTWIIPIAFSFTIAFILFSSPSAYFFPAWMLCLWDFSSMTQLIVHPLLCCFAFYSLRFSYFLSCRTPPCILVFFSTTEPIVFKLWITTHQWFMSPLKSWIIIGGIMAVKGIII